MTNNVLSLRENISPPSSLSDKTILVTGGAGLVGRQLVKVLAATANIRVLDHFQTIDPSELPDGVTIYQGDVCDQSVVERALDGADVVFHQAATSGPYALDNPVQSHAVNTTSTLQLLEQTRGREIRTIIASSAAIYGPTGSVPISEDTAKEPIEPYGVQKLAADMYGRQYNELYDQETVVLRYFNVYGYRSERSHRKNVVNIFIEQARAGSDIKIEGTGMQCRDFVHVSDVVRANLSAAVTSDSGEAFNVGTGNGTAILRLAELVRREAGDIGIIYDEARETDVDESIADLTKARHQLGYEPSVEIGNGIAALWEQYRRRKGEPV